MFCTGRRFSNFVVRTKKEIHIERILPDEEFWLQCVRKCKHFFQTACLPELLGKRFSQPSTAVSYAKEEIDHGELDKDQDAYCYCQGPEEEPMVACDNSTCPYQWFHFRCLKLQSAPQKNCGFVPLAERTQERARQQQCSNLEQCIIE